MRKFGPFNLSMSAVSASMGELRTGSLAKAICSGVLLFVDNLESFVGSVCDGDCCGEGGREGNGDVGGEGDGSDATLGIVFRGGGGGGRGVGLGVGADNVEGFCSSSEALFRVHFLKTLVN